MDHRISRRDFVKASAVTGLGLMVAPGCARPVQQRSAGSRPHDPDSRFFATVRIESFSSHDTESRGDLWPSCWADDDALYTANGDGWGFGEQSDDADIVVSRVLGTPESGLTGEVVARGEGIARIWAPSNYNRKPTGMIAVDGDGDGRDELYLAVQDLNAQACPACFNDAPNASISRSVDYGRTWHTTDAPMFTDHRFTTIFFLDYGRSQEHAHVLGPEGMRYVLAYGIDYNWRTPTDPTAQRPADLYLARVPRDRIQDRMAWEFYADDTPGEQATWTADIDLRRPVLHDERTVYPQLSCGGRPNGAIATNVGVISQGGVVYNAPLRRYIYTSWTWYTFEFYEAPRPWGPWRLFMRKDFGAAPWYGESTGPECPGLNEGGYPTTIPSRYISDDGRTMWVQSNTWERWNYACGSSNYNFSLRRLEVEPFAETDAVNPRDDARNIARDDADTTPIEKCAHHGRVDCYNDGSTDVHESSLDCDERKPLDFWGYTWPRRHNLNRVVYTAGPTASDGGWFTDGDGGLRVQVRQDFTWIDVDPIDASPAYPYDAGAAGRRFVLSFRDTWGDGVRIIGVPGGAARYTTIAELEVYYS